MESTEQSQQSLPIKAKRGRKVGWRGTYKKKVVTETKEEVAPVPVA